jgi:hypothetical protein
VSDRLLQIRLRRERLIAKAAAQRESLAHDVDALSPVIGVVDRGIAGAMWLREHPAVLLVAGGVMLVLRPRRTLRWSFRAFSLWQGYRQLTARLGVDRYRRARSASPAARRRPG